MKLEQLPITMLPFQRFRFRIFQNKALTVRCPTPSVAPDLSAKVAEQAALLAEQSSLSQRHELLFQESEHRLLNGLQIVGSLLTLQSGASNNPEVKEQLSAAAMRVAGIARVHRRLRFQDGENDVPFGRFLHAYCEDFLRLIGGEEGSGKTISVTGEEVILPQSVAGPLGLIVSELITNAVKYGSGQIEVSVATESPDEAKVTVSSRGAPLAQSFNPAAASGLGLKIVTTLVRQVRGELIVERMECGTGNCFSIRFPMGSPSA